MSRFGCRRCAANVSQITRRRGVLFLGRRREELMSPDILHYDLTNHWLSFDYQTQWQVLLLMQSFSSTGSSPSSFARFPCRAAPGPLVTFRITWSGCMSQLVSIVAVGRFG
ncbi:hypothetical protein EJ04DRAFT_516404 [Polyplosphaeria fusca]|uniref:Uncharacterized protein n=1 Tax=Polyplosphaeria fusca TaxID=682080 RepID=A0A9P4UXE5_9PLEO|nr:hypothetical protein EJ04DRAFT_516404 [Polyplosphaeria fusca]